jgi:hypothetical protein
VTCRHVHGAPSGPVPRAVDRAGSLLAALWLLASAGCVHPGPSASPAAPSPPEPAAAQAIAAGPAEPALPGIRAVEAAAASHPTFETYWYQGLAELTRYSLLQSRYGELHEGEAVLIHVTEDFLADRQVKHEFGDASSAVSVLKLNAYRRFYTGVYPYNVTTSVFLPVADTAPSALKVTIGVQEWCGHTYQQFNRRGDAWQMRLHSYFQAEGDQEAVVGGMLEDELWARVRLDPQALPVGELELVPAAHHLRFAHLDAAPLPALATLETAQRSPYGPEEALAYVIRYQTLPRQVALYVEPRFPHRIVAWEERVGDGPDDLTTAVLERSVLMDYWTHNGAGDAEYRAALGLEW